MGKKRGSQRIQKRQRMQRRIGQLTFLQQFRSDPVPLSGRAADGWEGPCSARSSTPVCIFSSFVAFSEFVGGVLHDCPVSINGQPRKHTQP